MSILNRLAFVTLPLALVAGCSSATPDPSGTPSTGRAETIGASEDALMSADEESSEAEGSMEEATELGLGGGDELAPEAGPPNAASVGDVDGELARRPARFFRNAGCITSTRIGPGEWDHVLAGCVGPYGRVTYTGTVRSKWTAENGVLTVVHSANGFEAKGPNVTVVAGGARTVTYTRSGDTVTRTRKGAWTGTVTRTGGSGPGKSWSHEADFTSTWDRGTRCITRDGTASNTVGNESFGRTVAGYKRCGVGTFGCPEAGTVTLTRRNGNLVVVIAYLGDGKVKVERNGKALAEVKLLFCRAE